ncbi:hypothetical protein WDU94_012458 [Cyamophila willieti]
MYILLACLSLAVLVYGDDSKHYLLKYPAPSSIEHATHPVESKPHDSVGATYQAITKRHYTGAASSSTTAEILNTITSPHSRSSVSFTTTSVHHPAGEPPHHPSPAPVDHSPSPPSPRSYNPSPAPHPVDLSPTPVYHLTPAPLVLPHPTPVQYTVSPPPPTPVVFYPQHPEHPISVPSQYYDLQHIVNDPEHSRSPSTYTYRIPPNQTYGYPPTPRVSPKAFSYQPVITLANNMKSFYKTFNYDPFVVPQPSEQYYASNYFNNLVYPGSEVVDIYNSYPTPSPSSYPAPSPSSYPAPSPSSYPAPNPSSYPAPYPPSPTPVPILPRVPLSLPPPEGLSLFQGVPKPYKDNAYIEPQRPLFTPVLVFKNIPHEYGLLFRRKGCHLLPQDYGCSPCFIYCST